MGIQGNLLRIWDVRIMKMSSDFPFSVAWIDKSRLWSFCVHSVKLIVSDQVFLFCIGVKNNEWDTGEQPVIWLITSVAREDQVLFVINSPPGYSLYLSRNMFEVRSRRPGSSRCKLIVQYIQVEVSCLYTYSCDSQNHDSPTIHIVRWHTPTCCTRKTCFRPLSQCLDMPIHLVTSNNGKFCVTHFPPVIITPTDSRAWKIGK